MNIPIYRAKKKYSDEYVIGYEYYNHIEDEYYITHYLTGNNYKIDRSTRSINFEDMLDSQGNRIFASLSDDEKGGDIVEYNGRQEIIKYSNGTIQTYMFRFEELKELNFKVVGIKE